MSYLGDKKAEHEVACEKAIQAGDGKLAVFHAAKAAEYCFALAKNTTGPVSTSYVATAEGWLEIAEKLKTAKLPKSDGVMDNVGGAKSEGTDVDDSEFRCTMDTGVSFDDIAGMAGAKAAVMDMIVNPMKHPEKAKTFGIKPGGGIILYGPPGNGKTMFGKAIAHEIAAPFFYASGAQIRSKWHGESEQKLSKLIKTAQSHPVAVLFLDEIDGLFPRRTETTAAVDTRLVSQFLADVGGFKDSPNTLLLLGATNKPWDIDEAVFRTGRFDEKLYIGAPDAEVRRGILKKLFDSTVVDEDVDIDMLAEELALYSGSDVVGLVRKACQIAFRRSLESEGEAKVTMKDFAEARTTIPASVTLEMLTQYETFNKERFGA